MYLLLEFASGTSAAKASSSETSATEATSEASASSESSAKERSAQERASVSAPVVEIVVIDFPLGAAYMSTMAAEVGDFFGTYASYTGNRTDGNLFQGMLVAVGAFVSLASRIPE